VSRPEDPPYQEVVESGVVPHLIDLLHRDDKPHLQIEAAWTLSNVAGGSPEFTQLVIDLGVVPIFVELVRSSSSLQVREMAAWALANIAGDGPSRRDLVLRHGALRPILLQMHRHHGGGGGESTGDGIDRAMLRTGAFVLLNFCRGRDPPPDAETARLATPTLARLLRTCRDEQVLEDACCTLRHLSNVHLEVVVESASGAVGPRLIQLLRHPSCDVQRSVRARVRNKLVSSLLTECFLGS
jgi:importin subunit alpha-6/7